MKHRSFTILFMLLSAVFLPGCWDRAELQDIDIVSAIGIDEGSDDLDNRYHVTVQVINEEQIASAQAGAKGNIAPVTIYSATGSNIEEALRKIAPKLPQELFYPHVQLLVIGEELAKKTGIEDLFDWVERDNRFRTLFPVLVAKNTTAMEVLQIMTSLEPIPSAKIMGALEATQETWGVFASTRADQVIQQLSGGAALLTGVQKIGRTEHGNKLTNIKVINPQAELEILGLGIFKDGKLQKWLVEDRARGAMLINNEVTKTIVNLNCEQKKKGMAVDVVRSKTKINVDIKDNKPVINVNVRSEAHVIEAHCPIDLSKHETIKELEKQMEEELKEEIIMAVEAAKEEKSDIFRFGQFVNRKDPTLWKEIEEKWNDEVFPETEVNVNVKGFIRRAGLRTNPYIK
ncbi:Ger(x)C family spore germination protein [Halalkalibacter flavus]|uniref:Ger(x)C family spore germination protein n=1 Tax=Halalkalibacter flavus TaxID=3090668 RepID=UPI002FCBA437